VRYRLGIDADSSTPVAAGGAAAWEPPTGRARARASHDERADRFFRRYGPAVYRRCLRLLSEAEEAKDATQEVFVKLLCHPERLEDPSTALFWAYRVATNHCLNVLRDARGRRQEALTPELELVGDVEGGNYPELQLVRAVLGRFDAQTQAVAVGVFVDGMEHEEIAEVLGISRRTVTRKLERFLENAKKFLARSET
jgi:RNA polymerase sigma-70 factor (ECF subfamily)